MGWFQDSIKTGLEQVAAAAGVSCVYIQDGRRIEGLIAVPGTGSRKAVPAEVLRRVGEKDWLIMRDRLIYQGVLLKPKRSDKLIAGGITHEVLPPAGKDFYDDPVDCQWRVHTKVVPG